MSKAKTSRWNNFVVKKSTDNENETPTSKDPLESAIFTLSSHTRESYSEVLLFYC